MKFLDRITKLKKETYIALFICFIFFSLYLTLSMVKHLHFQTGYDLSVDNQVVWEYSRFLPPTSTVHAYAFSSVFADHVELIYVLLAPFYWISGDARMLIFLQALAIGLSGIPVYLLAIKYKINKLLSLSLLASYFLFFGIQNAMWSDVHSLVLAASFLAFFIYYLDLGKKWPTILFFLLALTSKEDIGLLTFSISFIYFIRTKQKINLFIMGFSLLYLFFLFFIFFPLLPQGYRFANSGGLLSNINLFNFFNTDEKRQVIFYSLSSFGFLPLLNPLLLIPFIADLAHYFVIGSETATSTHGIFLHYRVTEAILLIWPVILIIAKFKFLNKKYFAIYILFFSILVTYFLHAPLTYLSKKWFWTQPQGVKNINQILKFLPNDAYVVTQNNISPHISNRKLIVTMWGVGRDFKENSPCGEPTCDWFKWAGDPKYMVVDTSPEWNILNLLANREDFISALSNMEKFGVIEKQKEIGSARIYLVKGKLY